MVAAPAMYAKALQDAGKVGKKEATVGAVETTPPERTTSEKVIPKAMKAAYLEWVIFAQTMVNVLIFLCFAFSFFAVNNAIQSVEYGVFGFAGALVFIVWFLFRIIDRYEDIRPKHYSEERFNNVKKLALLSVACIPIILSWFMNETLYGAINPIGYWRGELAEARGSNCADVRAALMSSIEGFQVSKKRMDMGIASFSDVQASVEVLKIFQRAYGDCVSTEHKRRTAINNRLNKLTGNQG